MDDLLNQLPLDLEWARKVDELAAAAAKQLGCMVVLVAVQPEGKLAIQVDGVPTSGPLADVTKDMPRFLATLATAAAMQDMVNAGRTRQ
jgi:hypothetical protein